jgi:nitroreductase
LESHAPLPAPEAIARRRAARRFDPDRPLADALLKQILHLATFAPSPFNLQPWRFLLIRSAANRQKLRACAHNLPKVTEAPVMIVVLGYHTPHRSHLVPMIDRMLELGSISPESAAELRSRAAHTLARIPDRSLWAMRSAMLAAATLMLAAESLGVASAPIEGFDAQKVKETFGVPEDHTVCCLIALGYAAEAKPFPGRFGLPEVCYEEHFGQPWSLGEYDE